MSKKLICFAVAFWVVAFVCFGYFGVHHLYPKLYADKVTYYADMYHVPQNLVYAVIKGESDFHPDAVSEKGAIGLMQITENTGLWVADTLKISTYSREMLYSPETNIQIGTYYLSYLLKMYHNNEKNAISAYNAGHANVDRWLDEKKYSRDGIVLCEIPYRETEKYVNLVRHYQKMYAFIYGA